MTAQLRASLMVQTKELLMINGLAHLREHCLGH